MVQLSFLDLPGEIRNKIYHHLLILPRISTPRPLGDPPLHPQIISTCHLIHSEALHFLYGLNTYLAHPNLLNGLPRLRLYYDTIRVAPLIALIRRFHIRIRLDCDPNFKKEKAAAAFTGMEELTIEVFQAAYGGSDHKVLELFEGVRAVGKSRVYGSVVAFPRYVAWLERSMMCAEGEDIEEFDGEVVMALEDSVEEEVPETVES